MNRSRRNRALGQGLIAVTLWGASFVATKIALRDLQPFSLIWLRFGLGVLVLGIIVLLRRRVRFPDLRTLRAYALLGFIGITLHQWLQVTGLQTARASTTAWIISTSPAFIAILGWAFLREPLNRSRVIGIALAAMGVFLITSNGDPHLLIDIWSGGHGNLLVLGSAITWAVFSVLSRHVLRSSDAIGSLLFVLASGWVLSTPFLFIDGTPALPSIEPGGWIAIGFLGIFCTGLAYILWYRALQEIPVSQAGSLLFLEPPVTVLIAATLLGEPITIVSLASGAVILLGVWMVTRAQHPLKTAAPSTKGRRGELDFP